MFQQQTARRTLPRNMGSSSILQQQHQPEDRTFIPLTSAPSRAQSRKEKDRSLKRSLSEVLKRTKSQVEAEDRSGNGDDVGVGGVRNGKGPLTIPRRIDSRGEFYVPVDVDTLYFSTIATFPCSLHMSHTLYEFPRLHVRAFSGLLSVSFIPLCIHSILLHS